MFWVKDNKTTLEFVQDDRTITVTSNSDKLKNHIVLGAEQIKLIRDELDSWLARNGYTE